MNNIYLDTNVLLAQWAPLDPYYTASNDIIHAIRVEKIKGYFSDFGLAEVASVVERQKTKFSDVKLIKIPLALEYVKKIRLIPNLELINTAIQSNFLIAGKKTSMSEIYWKSIDIAVNTQLKVLDTIHIAIVALMPSLQGKKMNYFITADQEILKKGKKIKQEYDFAVLSPEEIIRVEGL